MYGELKEIAKDAVAYGNGDDKKTVEYIIKWIHNHTNSDGVYDSDPRSTNKYDLIFATREQISFLYKKLENLVLN